MVPSSIGVPTLSLVDFKSDTESKRQKFVSDLFTGLKEFGFIVLRDHPISEQLLKRAYRLSQEFFELPTSTKLHYVKKDSAGARGYTPFGQEHAKDAKVPDLKEFLHVGRDANIWPQEIADFENTFKTLFHELDDVGRTVLQALTGPLEIPIDYFDHRTDQGSSILRLLHYPPIPEGVNPQCIRAAAHEDINLITILVSASTSGLELKDRNGKWLPVGSEPLELIVDSGDMLARITNEVIPSTTHRVVNPSGPNVSRYSMPFFMHPNPDVLLTCLDSCRGTGARYPDVLADDFLQERLRDIGLKK